MAEKPARPSFWNIYRQQYRKDREAERSNLFLRLVRWANPMLLLLAAVAGAKHMIPWSVSLIIVAACIVGLAALIIWSRHQRGRSGPGSPSSPS